MARISYPDPSDPSVSPLIEQIRQDGKWGDKVPNVIRMLMHSPSGFHGWMELFPAINRRSSLPARYRELVILWIAVINDSEYEFAAHAAPALATGLTQAQLETLRRGDPPVDLPEADRAVLAYTAAMTRTVKVPDATFASVRQHFDDRELVELTLTIAAYNLVSRFLEALQIDHDPR